MGDTMQDKNVELSAFRILQSVHSTVSNVKDNGLKVY